MQNVSRDYKSSLGKCSLSPSGWAGPACWTPQLWAGFAWEQSPCSSWQRSRSGSALLCWTCFLLPTPTLWARCEEKEILYLTTATMKSSGPMTRTWLAAGPLSTEKWGRRRSDEKGWESFISWRRESASDLLQQWGKEREKKAMSVGGQISLGLLLGGSFTELQDSFPAERGTAGREPPHSASRRRQSGSPTATNLPGSTQGHELPPGRREVSPVAECWLPACRGGRERSSSVHQLRLSLALQEVGLQSQAWPIPHLWVCCRGSLSDPQRWKTQRGQKAGGTLKTKQDLCVRTSYVSSPQPSGISCDPCGRVSPRTELSSVK